MKITVEAKNVPVVFMSMANEAVLPPKKDFDSGEQKVVDGKPVYTARALKAIRFDENNAPAGQDDSVSLSLLSQPEGGVRFGGQYALSGVVRIVHYVQNNGRLGVSITADGVRQVHMKSPQGGE